MASGLDYLRLSQRAGRSNSFTPNIDAGQVNQFSLGNVYSLANQADELQADQQRRRTIADIGLAASQGDMAGARDTAFRGGELETGFKLDDRQRAQAQQELEALSGFVKQAETLTPEQWGITVNQRRQAGMKLGPEYDGEPGRQLAINQGRSMLEQATIKLREAQTRQAEQRGDAATMNATSKRIKTYADALEMLGPNPTEARWAQLSQPGELLNVAFGGRVPPFAEAPRHLAQMRSDINAQFEPTEEDRVAGITREDKIKAFRNNRINEMYGVEPKTLYGKGVRLKPSGDFEPIPGSSTAGERNAQVIAKNGLGLLAEAERLLAKTGTLEQLAGDKWHIPIAGNVGGYGEAGRGFKAAEAAIMDLVFSLSGKQVSNKEREAFLDIYKPVSTETRTNQAWKLRQVRRYFQEVIRMREGGADDNAIADFTRQAIEEGARGPAGRAPNATPDFRSLSNEELLRQLNQ